MDVNEECFLLACDILQSNRDLLKLQKKPSAPFQHRVLFYPKYAGGRFLQYPDKFLSRYMATHGGRYFCSIRWPKSSIAFRGHVT
jgi:hypothetical protein